MRTKGGTLKSLNEASKQVEEHMSSTPTKKVLLPSGCDVLNLACSGSVRGFIEPGMIVNIVGDSDSGKTFLAMTILASIFQVYGNDYDYDYIDYERAVSFSIPDLFGSGFAKALNYIPVPQGREATIERWYRSIKKRCFAGSKPRVIVTDSFDNLTCYAELKALENQDKAKDGEEKDSSGMQKAKAASQRIGKLCNIIADNGSIIIIISQVRDGMPKGFVKFNFDTKTRNGGKALRFYSGVEFWLTKGERIVGSDKKRPMGGVTKVTVKRSRITGKYRMCEFPILYAYGVDNTRASIMFMASEGYWKTEGVTGRKYKMKEFDFVGKIRECIEFIEEKPERIKKLRKLVSTAWNEIEERVKKEALGNRKPKFA